MSAAAKSSNETDVLIVGAGPTGLALALWLARLGVRIRIVDKTADVAPVSRALGVHARTLEFYRQLGFADEVIAAGVVVASANLWARGRRVASVPFHNIGEGLTPYPFVLDLAQDIHERILIAHLDALGVHVVRKTELIDLEQSNDGVEAALRSRGGVEQCRCTFLAGCDGTHSTVRTKLGVDFAGGTYDRLFYVADVVASGDAVDNGIQVDLDEADLLAVFDMKGSGHIRLVGTVPAPDTESERAQLRFEDVARRPIEQMHLEIDRVNWFSTYRVHHKCANRFRVGRVFLLGDAAHVHSPVGAQGMNTGIGDAVNLAWKLAGVVKDDANEQLLDTYETERQAFAKRLVATTDRAFEIASSTGRLAAFVRTRVFPVAVSVAFRSPAMRRYLFRTVSQIMINYRESALSEGKAGVMRAGDRLPWVSPSKQGDADNYEPLKSLAWQVHVYGSAGPAVHAACEQLRVPLHEFAWRPAMRRAGLARDALYLVRPDGYVALAAAEPRVEQLLQYAARAR